MKDLIDINGYLTASNRFPERALDKALNMELLKNANILLKAVNGLLNELGITTVVVTSGYRPVAVNAKVANASTTSAHTLCMAVDILDDKEQSLANKCKASAQLLRKYGLWLENPDFTKGKNTNWCHLDTKQRKDRPSRMFNP
jgi:hypothetical protein